MNVLIYSKFHSPRLKYVCHQVFFAWYGWKYEITTEREVYLRFEGMCINYSDKRLREKELFVPSSDVLKLTIIKHLNIDYYIYNKIPAFFKQNIRSSDFPFDMFANIFFHLSRYEEYLTDERDEHGRFTAQQSWAFQRGVLQLPIVDLLVIELYNAIKKRFPAVPKFKRKFQKLLTYDIDMAWAYLHKHPLRSIGGLLKDVCNGKWQSVQKRRQVWNGIRKDPFQTFEQLDAWNKQQEARIIYFFLLGKPSQYDKNIAPSNKYFQQLIKNIASNYDVGIHPSYLSNEYPEQLAKEISLLEKITGEPIKKSRQHYLRLHLPTTYRRLIDCGIQEDYSMGYADQTGFRAATSLSFYWYDLEREEPTNLLIFPFQIMDTTLKDYLQLTPTEAKHKIEEMIRTIQSVNGVFTSLWHNSSFSYIGDWEDWGEVYECTVVN